jgi:hypothetical protein
MGRDRNTTWGGKQMGIDNEDLRREEATDRKVGVAKDAERIAKGDVKGTLVDDIDEMKADLKAIDDKVERAFGSDND